MIGVDLYYCIQDWRGGITKINLERKFAIINCGSEGPDFYAVIHSSSGGIGAYKISDAVNFEPGSNITRGLSTANTIRH